MLSDEICGTQGNDEEGPSGMPDVHARLRPCEAGRDAEDALRRKTGVGLSVCRSNGKYAQLFANWTTALAVFCRTLLVFESERPKTVVPELE